MKHFRNNRATGANVRHEQYDGRDHLVVPVVAIVEGVLNEALVLEEEFGRYPEAWNGRPVPVLHPEQNGEFVSANHPDILQNAIGLLFNVGAGDGKLRGEIWIDTQKAEKRGHGELLRALEAGQIIEVSTGYFADGEPAEGEFNGVPYKEIHRNIRPDHLALLPGQIGACSVPDGCGTRVNQKRGLLMNVNEAISTIRKALGLKGNCECKEEGMSDLTKKAEALKANGALTAKQFQLLTEMDEDQRAMVKALLDAMGNVNNEEEPPAEEEPPVPNNEEDEEPAAMKANKGVDEKQIDKLVANRVEQALRRRDVVERLKANERNPFDDAELATMSVEHLEKFEKSIRPADYSGLGGFASNAAAADTDAKPLTLNRGVLSRKQKEA